MRKAVLTLAVRHPALHSLINPRETTAIAYTASPLNADESDAFSAGPSPGTVLAECPLMLQASRDIRNAGSARRGHLTDLVGPCFTALRFTRDGASDPSFTELERRLHDAQIPFALMTLARHAASQHPECDGYDADDRLFELYGARDGTVYLVRPDGHVLGRWHDPRPADLNAALERALHPRTSADLQENA